jgi:hypothetical protein
MHAAAAAQVLASHRVTQGAVALASAESEEEDEEDDD